MFLNGTTDKVKPKVIVACQIMEPELEMIRKETERVEIRYLDQGLHRRPQDMPAKVQEHIDSVGENAGRIVLGYGLCSNGIVGVKARHQELIVPKSHDCIAFFMGSPEIYRRRFEESPGTYYLTLGWIAEKKDPLGIVEEEYMPKFGRETSMWVMGEELKHYTTIALVNTGTMEAEPLRQRAMENARVFGKEFLEIPGDLTYFRKLVLGPYPEDEFFHLPPGQPVTQEMFLV